MLIAASPGNLLLSLFLFQARLALIFLNAAPSPREKTMGDSRAVPLF